MAYNIEFKFQKLSRCRQVLREFCMRGISNGTVMEENKSAFNQLLKLMKAWLEAYLCKRGYRSDTRQFVSIECRDLDENPMADFLQSKEMDGAELAAHFGLLFALADGNYKSVTALLEAVPVNDTRLRNVLKAYEAFGMVEHRCVKQAFEYRLIKPDFPLDPYCDLCRFFGEINPLGVLGHFINQRNRAKFEVLPRSPFRFRHHYLYHVMDAEILEKLLEAIHSQVPVRVKLYHWVLRHEIQYKIPQNYRLVDRDGMDVESQQDASKCWLAADVIPVKIYASVRTGRRYLMGYYIGSGDFAAIRLDRIESVSPAGSQLPSATQDPQYKARFAAESQHLWGVSASHAPQTVHVEMEIMAPHPNAPILARIESEKRCGSVERISPYSARFSADVYDGRELFPWLYSFVGYIIRVSFSDPSLMEAWEKGCQRG